MIIMLMLIFQKNADVREGEKSLKIRTHADKGRGKKWAKTCGRPLWMAPNICDWKLWVKLSLYTIFQFSWTYVG